MMYKKRTRKHKSNRKSIKTHRRVRHIKMRKMNGGIGCGCKSDIGSTLPNVLQDVRINNPNVIMKGGSCGVCGNSSMNIMQKGGASYLVPWESSNPGNGGNYFTYSKYGATSAPNAPVSTSGNGPLPPRQNWSTELGPQDKHIWQQNGGKRRKIHHRKSKKHHTHKHKKYNCKHHSHRRKSSHRKSYKKSRKMNRTKRGGYYQQYLGNVPFSMGMKMPGMNLPSKLSALANPTIFKPYNNCMKDY